MSQDQPDPGSDDETAEEFRRARGERDAAILAAHVGEEDPDDLDGMAKWATEHLGGGELD